MSTIKFIDDQDRTELNEGRDYGMGFGFCIKKDENEFHTVMPISPCKDYVNDVIFIEKTRILLPRIHGFKYEPTGCIGDKYTYVAGKVTPLLRTSKQPKSVEIDKKALIANYKNIEKGLNEFDDIAKVNKTKIELIEDTIILKVDSWWCEQPWRLSYYLLIARNFIHYNSEKDSTTFLITDSAEAYILKGLTKKFIDLVINKKELTINNPLLNINHDNADVQKYIIHSCGLAAISEKIKYEKNRI